MRRETGYFWSNIHTCTTQDHLVNSLADVGNGGSRQGGKQVTSGQTYTYTTQDYSLKLTR